MKYLQQIKAELIPRLNNFISRLKSFNEDDPHMGYTVKHIKVFSFLLSFPLIIVAVYHILIFLTPSFHHGIVNLLPVKLNDSITGISNIHPPGSLKTAGNRVRDLEKSYTRYKNAQSYLLVNTTENKFTLYNRGKILRDGVCSTGSYILLDAGDEKKWKFETPKGLFRVQGKIESPVWKKPDWAFVEEGLPVPPSYSHLRYEYGVLGDYALSIGNGYLIHGTLYKRLLGMPVTHGCIRMDDEDLAAVFKTLTVGSKVYIY